MAGNNRWRIGLISDLHGNLVALEAALAALKEQGVDQLLCLGDVAVAGPEPHATVAELRDLHCPVVMGNTDAWAIDPHPFPERNEETPIVYAIESWGAQQLSTEDRHFLSGFAPTITLELGETKILCYHGSPRSNIEQIRATTTDQELEQIFEGYSATVAIGGHTHTQMVRRYREMLLINPGSVGAPVTFGQGETHAYYPFWTEFGVLEVGENAQGPTLQVQLHRVPINRQALVAAVKTSDMPYADWYLARWRAGSHIE